MTLSRDWAAVGSVMILASLGIKGALVPAHTWLPDAYGRAPSSISAFLSGIVSQTHLYALIRVGIGLGWPSQPLGLVLLVVAPLNMTLGNLMGLVQIYGKRLLGYSSIAQTGYMLVAFGIGLVYELPEAFAAGFFFMVAHGVLKALAFLCKGTLHYVCKASRIEELDGLYARVPFTSLVFGLALVGLAGIPPLPGFMAKWQIIASLPALWSWRLVALVFFFAANALIGLGYYIPVAARLFRKESDERRVSVSAWMSLPIAVLALLAVALGLFPGPMLQISEQAALGLLGGR